jgi:hypothetical protein
VLRARDIARRAVGALWSGQTWRCTLHLTTGAPLAAVACSITVALLGVTVALAVTALLAVPSLAALLACSRGFTALQRSRFAALLGVELTPARRPWTSAPTWWRRLAEARARSTHRQVRYHAIACLIAPLCAITVTALWVNGVIMATVVAHRGGARACWASTCRTP